MSFQINQLLIEPMRPSIVSHMYLNLNVISSVARNLYDNNGIKDLSLWSR
jgi:hypothetical protein